MVDRYNDIDNYNELKFSREQGFFDKSLFIRFLIASIFAASIFLILHFREVRIEIFELNSIAPSYVVAQVDVDFFDEEATLILRQEALRDVGKIYQISDSQIRQRRIEFENFLIYNQDWRKYTSSDTFEELFVGIDKVEKVLLQMRFTDPRTLQKLREMAMETEDYQLYTPSETNQGIKLPETIWDAINKAAFAGEKGEKSTADFIISFLKQRTWLLIEDIPTQRQLRKLIQSKVPEKMTHVSAGSRILDQGERVTARHIAMMQAMKKTLGEQRRLWHPMTIFGSLVMSLLLTGVCAAYFRINYPQILSSNRKLFLLVTVIILTLGLSKMTELFILNTTSSFMEMVGRPLFVPFASILICSLINPSVATFVAGFLTILLTMTLSFDHLEFMVMNLAASVVAVLSTRSLRHRKEIFVVCSNAWLACVAVIISMHLYANTLWEVSLISEIISAGIFMVLTAILVVGLLPMLESVFGVMTDVTLMEYMDPNNDLLRRLTIEAPGTYQHSVVLGNLTEAAATAIGANGLFCRVATLYHDVGKMATPQYFTENQQGGMNLHQLLTPQESAQVIIAHVSEGVSLARKAGLPEQFIDIIKEHHGTTLVYYFYRKQLELVGGDPSKVDEKEFRYTGPKPRSKESAIIMIADSLEAASRSLEKVTEETVAELAQRLIRDKVEDGQFSECLLTFQELARVKETLVKMLVAYWHARIKYPKKDTPSNRDLQMISAEA